MFEDAQPRKTIVRVNTKAHLVAKHTDLEEQLAEALANEPAPKPARATGKRDTTDVDRLVAEIEAVEAEMEHSWVDFTLQPRTVTEWRKFCGQHPPEIASDLGLGVDVQAVLEEFVPRCITDPVLTAEDWARAIDQEKPGLWPGDQMRLAWAVIGFYIATMVDVPKSRLLSAARRISGEQHEQPEHSVSPAAGSQGGSRRSGSTTTRQTGHTPATP